MDVKWDPPKSLNYLVNSNPVRISTKNLKQEKEKSTYDHPHAIPFFSSISFLAPTPTIPETLPSASASKQDRKEDKQLTQKVTQTKQVKNVEEKDHQFPLFQRNPSVKPHESRYNLPRTKTLRSPIPPPDTQHPVNPTSRTLQQPHKPAQSIPHTLEEIRTVGSNREGHRPQVRPGGVLHEAVSDRDIVAAPIADTWRRPWR